MRFIHLSDLHLGWYPKKVEINPGKVKDAYRGLRRIINNITFENLGMAIDYAIDNGIKLILVAGDIFDDVDQSLIYSEKFAKYLEKAVENDIHVVMIAGNHDAYMPKLKRASTSLFTSRISKYIRYVDVFSPAHLERGMDLVIDIDELGVSIVPLPHIYIGDLSDWRSHVRRYVEDGYKAAKYGVKILLAHIQLERVRFSKMYRDYSEEAKVLPTLTVSDVRHDLFTYLALGHIHLMQRIASDHIYYSGSLNRLRFDEALDDKYFLDVSVDGDRVRVSPIKVNPINMRYVTVEYHKYPDVDDLVSHVLDEVDGCEDSLIKILFRVVDRDLKSFLSIQGKVRNRLIKNLFEMGVYAVKMERKVIESGDGGEKYEIGESAKMSLVDSLMKYIETRYRDLDEKERKQLYMKALEYLRREVKI